jgi:hypothetical protein
MRCYQVKVRTTNAIQNTFLTVKGEYLKCDDGILFVITDDPRMIYSDIGYDKVLCVEDIGYGHLVQMSEE